MVQSAFLLWLVLSLAVNSASGADAQTDTCTSAPSEPAVELIYRLEPGERTVTPDAREEALDVVCARLHAFGREQGLVEALDKERIRVVVADAGGDGIARRLAKTGQLQFYDWEPNLIGRERRIGGRPGLSPPRGALKQAKREWRATGRDPSRPANLNLILSGAFPTVYGAVRLASEQEPRAECEPCSAAVPRFYLFERSAGRELVAGPVTDRSALRRIARRRAGETVILAVPVGTAIVSDQPLNSFGEPVPNAAPGWFALRDRPALSADDIVDPRQEFNAFNQPNVTFEFTERGRAAFQKVTRAVAARGRARAERSGGRVSGAQAEELSGRFALVFDGEVMTLPTVDFSQYPHGIDGRTGAEIAGGFANIQEAHDLATILRSGALPVEMTLVRHGR